MSPDFCIMYWQAESLVKAQQEMGEIMGELGLAFIKLTKFENEQTASNTQRVRASDMKNVATAAVKVSRLYRELNAYTVKHFVSVDKVSLSLIKYHSILVKDDFPVFVTYF